MPKSREERFNLELSVGELIILNNALNEVCHGIAIEEFSTRLGASKEQVMAMLERVNLLIPTDREAK